MKVARRKRLPGRKGATDAQCGSHNGVSVRYHCIAMSRVVGPRDVQNLLARRWLEHSLRHEIVNGVHDGEEALEGERPNNTHYYYVLGHVCSIFKRRPLTP